MDLTLFGKTVGTCISVDKNYIDDYLVLLVKDFEPNTDCPESLAEFAGTFLLNIQFGTIQWFDPDGDIELDGNWSGDLKKVITDLIS